MKKIPTHELKDISGGLECLESIGYMTAIMGGAFFATTGFCLPVLHNPRAITPLTLWVLSGALGGTAMGLMYCTLAPVVGLMYCEP